MGNPGGGLENATAQVLPPASESSRPRWHIAPSPAVCFLVDSMIVIYRRAEEQLALEQPLPSDVSAQLFEMFDHIKWLSKQSEAGAALVACGNVDSALRHALLSHMRRLTAKEEKNLFRGYGPLSTLSAKIDLAYAFSLVDRGMCRDLHIVREIRNVFAHAETPMHFGSNSVVELCEKFEGAKGLVPEQLRNRYIGTCEEILTHLQTIAHRGYMAQELEAEPVTTASGDTDRKIDWPRVKK
jgi:hypothetical protein